MDTEKVFKGERLRFPMKFFILERSRYFLGERPFLPFLNGTLLHLARKVTEERRGEERE